MDSFSLNVPFRLTTELKEDGEHYYTIGEISTSDKDFVNDIVTKNCLMSMANQINSGKVNLDFEHEAFKGDTEEERMIAKAKVPRAKFLPGTAEVNFLGKNKYNEDRWGLTTKSEINRNHKEFKSNLANIKEDYLHSYSIAYIPTKYKDRTVRDEQVRYLDDLTLLNTAFTGNPCNTKATMREVVTKSLTAMDEYKKLKEKDPSIEKELEVKSHSPDESLNDSTKLERKDNMTEETIEKAPVPVAPETPEAAPAESEEVKSMKVENATLKARLEKMDSDIRALKEAPAAKAEVKEAPQFKGLNMLSLCR